MARERKHLFHVGLDEKALRKIRMVAVRDGISQAEATRRIIDSCDIDRLQPPPPKKRRAVSLSRAHGLSTVAEGGSTSA